MKNSSAYKIIILLTTSACMVQWPGHASAQNSANVPAGGSAKISSNKSFRDCADCPHMVTIPGGSFSMGSAATEVGRRKDGDPAHPVKISTFAMGKTEITRGQFAQFVKATGYTTGNKCWIIDNGKYEDRSGNWGRIGFKQDNNHPVVCISWNDANAYTKWLARKTGKPYRLPSEAEWEYAARGKTLTARYWGESPNAACTYANVADKTIKETIKVANAWKGHNCKDGFAYTAPVGSFKANAYGLNDMLGNVWEWTQDSYHKNYEGAPADGSAWQDEEEKRVLRGGSWYDAPRFVRSAGRDKAMPDSRYDNIGFRVVRMLP